MERRQSLRCPVCKGPALADETKPQGVRCRRSSCPHNHAEVACPRCGQKNLAQVNNVDDGFSYSCDDCTYHWVVAGKK